MQYTMKEVYYDVYCKQCVYAELAETDDPCNECLAQGWNENNHKPIKYEADPNLIKIRGKITSKLRSLGRKK